MIIQSTHYPPSPALISSKIHAGFIPNRIQRTKASTTIKCHVERPQRSHSYLSKKESNGRICESLSTDFLCSRGLCCCGRRSFFAATKGTPSTDPTAMNSIRPPRPDWYEELYAFVLDKATKAYEAEVATYKSQLFAYLRGKDKTVLEMGIGTGPNLKYYAGDDGVSVFGIDPNQKMEKYARTAAEAAGLPATSFKFIQAVAEALPLDDACVDAVVGTLVLCSVKDVDMTLKEVRRVLKPNGVYLFVEHVAAKDGTILRFVQGLLDPLQQTVADGCHLTRKIGESISEAGFSSVDINTASLSTASLLNPHVYGIARK